MGLRQFGLPIGSVLGLGLIAASGASAAVVVKDQFSDQDRSGPAAPAYSENGVDVDGDGDIESAWFNGGTGSTMTVSSSKLVMGVDASSGNWTTYFTPSAATSVNLANTGDQLKITWAFRTGTVNATNTSQNFRIGIMNTPDADRISADGIPGSAAYTGYALFGNMGQTTGRSTSFQLMERNVASGATLGTSTDWAALANGLGNGVTGYADNTDYVFTALLTRNATNGLDITMTMAGGSIGGTGTATVSFTDATPNSFAYNSFMIRPSSAATTANSFTTSLFQVEGPAVPEPTTLAALGLGGLLLGRRRRA